MATRRRNDEGTRGRNAEGTRRRRVEQNDDRHGDNAADSRRDESAVADFISHFGALMQASGMPGLSAHVFAALLADPDGRMTGSQLGETLGVSPAAISTATSYLSTIGMTRKIREPGSRHLVHALISDDWYAVLVARNDVVGATRRLLAEGARAVGGPSTPAGRRLWLNGEMFAHLGDALTNALAEWERHKADLLRERALRS